MMKSPALGPVELTLIALGSERPSLGFLGALFTRVQRGEVRLADFVIMEKSLGGKITVIEVDTLDLDVAGLELLAAGLIGDEDLRCLSDRMASGTSAVVVALELSWATVLAQDVARTGAVVIGTERIPAPVVNAVLEEAADD